MKNRFRRLFTGMLSAVMTLSAMPLATIHGENEVQRYPYTFFAGSSAEGAITINANNVCINGNIATNGTITSTSANFNVNGTITENAAEPMVQCFAKIDNTYFDPTVVETYFEDYFLEDTNINVNTPIEAEGDIELIGNIKISSGLKALNDVNLSGNVENTQNSAICSETGDIIIDTENVNLSGLVYAPNGNVNISAMNLNINGVVIIADTITIDCPSLNANYSAAVGEFIGTSNENEPETELYLITYGEYIHETESIKVYWNTNVPQGTFDIQVSDDGESYTSVGTVTDEESYEYAITEPFSQKYIKVIETIGSGDSFESSPIIVKNSNNGYDIEPLDSDEDGLPDFFELKIGTALDNADTDNDGLTDYQEFAIVGTDPVIFDSAEEGTSDADYDSDSDGLSNIDEVTRTTDPGDPDTDMDGLSDYDEIFVYNTDPLVADSDNDGIDDGSEIKLGLDPNSAATHGVPDGEYKMDQAIDTDNGILSSINTEESPYSLSIEMNTNGDIEKEISVVNSGYSNVIENNAMIGASLDISMSDTCDPEDIVLKYDIKPEFTVNTLDKYSALPEFQGIKRLNVFKFNEEEGMLLPIETKFSDNGTQLYAEVDELGTYCVMDMEIWLDNLGVDMPEDDVDISSLQVSYPSSTQIMADEKKKDVPTDLVFILQTSGYDKETFLKEKKLISNFCTHIFSSYDDVKAYIIPYDVTSLNSLRHSDISGKELNNIAEVNNTLDKITYFDDIYMYCDRSQAFRKLIYNTPIRENADVYVYQLMNGRTESQSQAIDNWSIIDGVKSGKYTAYSEIGSVNWKYDVASYHIKVQTAIETNNDLFININEAESSELSKLKKHFKDKKTEPLYEYNIIVPTRWKTITLKDKLKKSGKTNSDTDSLTDWQEVIQDKIKVDEHGEIVLPMFNLAEAIDNIKRYNDGGTYNFLTKEIRNIPYLPIKSDPTDEDTDDDGLLDDEDREPQKVFLNDLLIKLKLMEKYIDDYCKDQYLKDLQNYEHPQIDENPIMAMNILRDLFYGTGHNPDIKKLNDYLSSKRHILQWWVADGSAFPLVRRYIEKQNTSILPYFRQYKLYDKEGNYIDFLHMLTVLAAERHADIFHDPNLAGWAGDLQSFIQDLKLVTYGKNYDHETMNNEAYNIISNYEMYNPPVRYPKFPNPDFFADLDAKNIACEYNESELLSFVLKDYYYNLCHTRITSFISNMGGEEKMIKSTNKYTHGNHILLTYFSLQAFSTDKIQNIYNNDKDKENPIFITDLEADALEFAFLKLIGLVKN